MSVLDEPGWSALTGPHASMAVGAGRARAYPDDVSMFAAVDPSHDHDAGDLADLLGEDRMVVLCTASTVALRGAEELFRLPGPQFVCERPLGGEPPEGLVELGAADADDMVELTTLTEPGPFLAGTWRMGTYVGIRRSGRLVAMAGERMHPAGATEISAVCTHPEARREGLAAALTAEVGRRIQARGEVPFLHTMPGNESAQRVYLRLGFEFRRDLDFVGVRPIT